MTKKNPKVFLIQLWIKPTKENMAKFYDHSRCISEIKKGSPYIDEWYQKQIETWREEII